MLTSSGSACQGGGGIEGVGDGVGAGGGCSAEVVVALQISICLVRALINSYGASSSIDQAAAGTGTGGNGNQECASVLFPSDLREEVIGGLYKLLVVFGISTGCELLAAAHLQVCSSSSSGATYPDWVERVRVSASAGDAKKFRSALKTLYVQYVK
jgi:hypothetical protein